MARQHGVAAVAQMDAEAGAGGDGGANAGAIGGAMTQCSDHAGPCQALDEGQCAGRFRRQGHEADVAAGCVLQALKFLPIGRPDMSARMGAARAVFRRDVRSLQVDARDRGSDFGIVLASAAERR